ncbi:hypothetical protein REPUB_Repub20aG0138300 [Reevesia pubescens]
MNSGNLIAGAMETMAVFTSRAPPGGALPGLELVGVARGGQEVDNRLTVRRWSVYLGFISLAMMVISWFGSSSGEGSGSVVCSF